MFWTIFFAVFSAIAAVMLAPKILALSAVGAVTLTNLLAQWRERYPQDVVVVVISIGIILAAGALVVANGR